MKKILLIIVNFVFFFTITSNYAQKFGNTGIHEDEYYLNGNNILDDFEPISSYNPTENCDCVLDGSIFIFGNRFSFAIFNNDLINSANYYVNNEQNQYQRLLKWYDTQYDITTSELEKIYINGPEAIKFDSSDEAIKFVQTKHAEIGLKATANSLHQGYKGLYNSTKTKQNNYLEDMKMIQGRKIEINNGQIYNSKYKGVKVNGKYLEDFRDSNSINQEWLRALNEFGKNNINHYNYNNYVINSTELHKNFDLISKIVAKINSQLQAFSAPGDRLNIFQFYVNYLKGILAGTYNSTFTPLPNEFEKYNLKFTFNDYVDNYIHNMPKRQISVFDNAYFGQLFNYVSYRDWTTQYNEALAKWEKVKEDYVDNLLNDTEDFAFEVSNLVSNLGFNKNGFEHSFLLSNKDFSNKMLGLLGNNLTARNKNYVKGQIELESKFENGKILLKYNPGLINGRSDQKYTHFGTDGVYGYYRMENGSIVISSPTQLFLNSDGNLTSRFTSEFSNSHYWYIKDSYTKEWSNYLIKFSDSTYSELETLFRLGAQNALVGIGTYIIPVEDFLILFTGKDFDGIPTSRWLAAGLLVVEVIPGGKLVKMVKVIPSGVSSWSLKVINASGKTTSLNFKIVNGLITFGDRGNLAKIIGKKVDEEAHHIIPWGKLNELIVQRAAKAGFHMNSKINGIALKKYRALTGEGLHGNHPAYDKYVQKMFDNFLSRNPNLSPELAKNFLENILIPDLLYKINLAKNSGLNLNEFFKRYN